MRGDDRSNDARAAAAGAAIAVTIALGALLHELFAPAPTSFGEQVAGAARESSVTPVEIIPARIEVVARRPRELAENDPLYPAGTPGS